MTVAGLLNLEEPITLLFRNHADTNSNVKPVAEVYAYLFRKLSGARRHQIDVLSHTRLRDVRIHRGGPEHNDIVAPAQEIEHCFVYRRQRQRFAHGKLLKCKRSGVQHRRRLYDHCGGSSIPDWLTRYNSRLVSGTRPASCAM